MSKLSAIVIAKNEADFLATSLASLHSIADEIIVVDTGSDDNTVEIAQRFTPLVSSFTWINDFSAAHNHSRQLASHPYVLQWDADFVITPSNQKKLRAQKAADFGNKNLVAVNWETRKRDSGHKEGAVLRNLIFCKDEFHYVSPVHAHLEALPGTQVRDLQLPDITIEHHKLDPKISGRQSQTRAILLSQLAADPTNHYLLFHLILALANEENNAEVITQFKNAQRPDIWQQYQAPEKMVLVEKAAAAYLQTNHIKQAEAVVTAHQHELHAQPTFILLQADLAAAQFKSAEATGLYQAYLARSGTALAGSNYYRYATHPLLMLGDLSASATTASHYYRQALKQAKRANNQPLVAEITFLLS